MGSVNCYFMWNEKQVSVISVDVDKNLYLKFRIEFKSQKILGKMFPANQG